MGARVRVVSTILRHLALVAAAALPLSLAACAADTQDENPTDPNGMEASDLSSRTIQLGSGTTTFTLHQATASDMTVTVDCHPPANPDDVGPVFKLDASTLGTSASDPARAGFWSRTGSVDAGDHVLKLTNLSAPTSCTIRTTAVPTAATCRESFSFRSPNTNHTHFKVGTDTSSDWEAFPVSGNHWGSWAAWSKVYPKAIKRGFLLHNLEHGGLVLSYKCASDEGANCAAARDKLVALSKGMGPRVIITPDPTQPEMFAIRAWRYGYSSSCLDETSAKAFATAHAHHGREDIDASPPIPFDPTTTDVPCQDLMAAPDSCPN